jgi:hypothetical protein|nr:MAG TPA: hypothetical protein [Caudoviricetes sp.]
MNFAVENTNVMNILFKNTKENKCYEEFVEDPSDRKKLRAFNKIYGPSIAGESVKLHKRLKQYDTAANYNKVYGLTANRIEIKNGGKDKDPFILKVRVTGAFRKFFYHIVTTESLEFLKKKDWKGAFEEVSYIYVIEINNHDYNIK